MNLRAMDARISGYAKAAHFGPTVLVVSISFFISLTQFSTIKSAEISVAIFAGQLVVGWTNDLIDFPLDAAAKRINKPLVAGTINAANLRRAIFIALTFALFLSYMGPMGIKGTAVHTLGLLSATAYNIKLKKTVLSIFPYIVSFGLMPLAVYVSARQRPNLWLELTFITFACSFHFLNVIKDLEWDLAQGVLGLPQRLGKNRSIFLALLLASLGISIAISKWQEMRGA